MCQCVAYSYCINLTEQWYEQKHDAGYSESHEKAESHWSGTPWTNTEDEK
jgi:hypothetical protein